jgi:hypothetical protein
MKLGYFDRFKKKKIHTLNFMKIRLVGGELFYADGRTDRHMAKLIVAFRSSAKAPKKDRKVALTCNCSTNLTPCLYELVADSVDHLGRPLQSSDDASTTDGAIEM